MPRLRTAALNTALVCVSLLVCAVFFEVALRILGVAHPIMTRIDPDLGFALRPGASWYQNDEGEAMIRINAAGFRDRDHDLAKPEGVARVAVLGDSFVEARQVEENERFTAVLAEKCGADVLNFGVSGYGTGQEYTQLKRDVLAYSPDVVLLTFFPGNDIMNNSAALTNNPQIPFYTMSGGELRLDTSFRDTAFYRSQQKPFNQFLMSAINRSRVLQLLNKARSSWGKPAPKPQGSSLAKEIGELGLDYTALVPPSDAAWTEAWNLTDALIEAAAAEAKARGAEFAVAVIGAGLELNPDAAVRSQAQAQLGIEDFGYPYRRLKEIGDRLGFPVIDTTEEMRGYAEANAFAFDAHPNGTSGHWNETGHRIAGEIIARTLCPSR